MPDYSSGKIYMVYPKVEDPDEGDVYYGSTVDTLARRMNGHRSKNKCSSKILFDKYGVENCFIELVEEYPCETREQLNKKEGEYIRANKCINKRIAGRTIKEYYVEHHDKMKEYHKEYRIDNKDKYKEYSKQYKIDNRDNILEYHKQYYDKTKDKISEQNKQKASCPICNKELTKINMTRHIKTHHK